MMVATDIDLGPYRGRRGYVVVIAGIQKRRVAAVVSIRR